MKMDRPAKKKYRNVFAELGKTDREIQEKLKKTADSFFYGEDKVYFPVGEDLAYIEDTGNIDVRTEGMSYGMMMCVQLDKKEEFDRLWKWAKTYMWMASGENEGYFAWSCQLDGQKNAYGRNPCAKGCPSSGWNHGSHGAVGAGGYRGFVQYSRAFSGGKTGKGMGSALLESAYAHR